MRSRLPCRCESLAVCVHPATHETARRNPKYRELWARAAAAPCSRIGLELTGPARDAAGLDHGRRWHRCDHPSQPLGTSVCTCRGCGPQCGGYSPFGVTTGGVPKVIHQIWLGGRKLPDEFAKFRETWAAHFPDWTHRLWTDGDDYGWMTNRDGFESATSYSAKSDWLRYEILAKFGGVYIDTDFECLKPFHDLIDGLDCWTASEGVGVSVGIMGAAPRHPLFERLVKYQTTWDREHYHERPDKRSGPGYFTAAMNRYVEDGNPPIKVFPPDLFYPYSYSEKHRRHDTFPDAVAVHHWAGSWSDTRPPVNLRHLVYHLLPVGTWREGVDELRARWDLFNGRKVIAVLTGDELKCQGDPKNPGIVGQTLRFASPDVVREYLPPGCEVIEVPNDPGRWELSSWPLLWGTILDGADAMDAVFYAHSKAVTRPPDGPCRDWAKLLYTVNLDHWSIVEEQLRRLPICGAFLKRGVFFGPPSDVSKWHYSGNFWWARVGEFRWPAVAVPPDNYGAEAWIGVAYRADEAGQIGPLQGHPGIDFYNQDFTRSIAVPAHQRWLRQHPKMRPFATATVAPGGIRFTFVVPTTGRRSIDHTLRSITEQFMPGDELIVQRDATGDWGATPRTRGQEAATGTHILWMDDDDVYTPGAIARIRAAVAKNPARPHLFRIRREERFNDVLWREPRVAVGNVSTQMFCVPNDRGRLGKWGVRYEGDFDFINDTLSKYPVGSVIFIDDVVAVWRPGRHRLVRSVDRAAAPGWWRHDPDTWDTHAWAEVVAGDEYDLASIDLRGAAVLDVGAHIGCFAWAARQHGAAVVHCYEPEAATVEYLRTNATRMPGVVVYAEQAVGGMVDPWFRQGTPIGVQPTVVSLNEAVARLAAASPSGRVELIKMDCEGGEWPALSGSGDLRLVDAVVGEWHDREWGGRRWLGPDVEALLNDRGFDVTFYESQPNRPPGNFGLFRAVRRPGSK